jgi:two-component system, NarL family, nitrate/nitrite response regulator NarL
VGHIEEKDIRIAFVDDHEIVRRGLRHIFEGDAGFTVVAEGGSRQDALLIAERDAPDVMLIDLLMPGGGGIEALKAITEDHPAIRCVIITASDDAAIAMKALKLGARGYILKGVSGRNLLAAIRTVMDDASYISPEFAAKLVEAAQAKKAVSGTFEDLSYRETQIIGEVEKGLTNREVATRLKISEKTVKYYMTSLMQKYGVSNRVGAVIAHRNQNTEERQSQH